MRRVVFLLAVLLQSWSGLASDAVNVLATDESIHFPPRSQPVLTSDAVSVVYKSIFGGSTWWVGWNENGLLDSLEPRLLEDAPNPVQARLKVTYLPQRGDFGDPTTRRRLTLTVEAEGARPEVLDFLVWKRDSAVAVLDAATEKLLDNTSFCALKVCVLRFTIGDRAVVLHERFSSFKHKQISVSITHAEGHLFEWFARHVRMVTFSTILKKEA